MDGVFDLMKDGGVTEPSAPAKKAFAGVASSDAPHLSGQAGAAQRARDRVAQRAATSALTDGIKTGYAGAVARARLRGTQLSSPQQGPKNVALSSRAAFCDSSMAPKQKTIMEVYPLQRIKNGALHAGFYPLPTGETYSGGMAL